MTILYENPMPPQPPKKHTLLPVLTALFLVSYALMTMLIVEQGSTIQSQRSLILQLFQDSNELSALRIKAHNEQLQKGSAAQAGPKQQTPSTQAQAPSSQAPATQTPSTQAPSTQAPQQRAQNEHSGVRAGKPEMQRPARPASDVADERRAVKSI